MEVWRGGCRMSADVSWHLACLHKVAWLRFVVPREWNNSSRSKLTVVMARGVYVMMSSSTARRKCLSLDSATEVFRHPPSVSEDTVADSRFSWRAERQAPYSP